MSIAKVSLGEVFSPCAKASNCSGMRIWEFTYSKGQVIPRHEHQADYICLLLSGDTIENCQYGETSYASDRLAFIPRGARHQAVVGPEGARFLGFELDKRFFSHGLTEHGLPCRPIYRNDPNLNLAIQKSLLAIRFSADPLLLECFALEIASVFTTPGNDSGAPWLKRVRQYLHDCPEAALNITALADLAQRHPTHIMREFKRLNGETLSSYLRKLRIDMACRLIRSTSMPLSEVGHQCGFADQSHFIRTFRLVMGRTPSAFRRMIN